MTIAIVDYGSGNLRSAAKALERAARESGQPGEVLVTSDPQAVAAAERVVLPGVGAFGDCRAGLHALPGMVEALEEVAGPRARPLLGICVGMQLFASRGLEHGRHAGFGWIPGEVVKLTPRDPSLKIPQMGWNELVLHDAAHPVLSGLPVGAHAYFVHSYHLRAETPAQVLAEVDYGGPVSAVVGRDTLIGTQFHPEKSQATGLKLLANFLAWRP